VSIGRAGKDNQDMLNKMHRIADSLPRLLTLDRRIDEMKINQGRMLAQMQRPMPGLPLWHHEFKVFSQWGEDGIIQYLVKHLRIDHQTFIEFGVEDFSESNCRFLLVKDHWRGFVIDGSEENMRRLRAAPWFWQTQLQAKASFITRENIASILEESGFDKALGILSVDIDGVDWHVLKALDAWRPAILIVEYNEVFGYERAVTVPYDAQFVRSAKHPTNIYYGASLPAFASLAHERGYALVGTNGVASNAFFVRRELLNDAVREVALAECARPAAFRESRGLSGELTFLAGSDRARAIAEMPLLDVERGEFTTVGAVVPGSSGA
jgi:hypothetical protein